MPPTVVPVGAAVTADETEVLKAEIDPTLHVHLGVSVVHCARANEGTK